MTEKIRTFVDGNQVKVQLRSDNRRTALRKRIELNPLLATKLGILIQLSMYKEWYMDVYDEYPF